MTGPETAFVVMAVAAVTIFALTLAWVTYKTEH